MPSNETGFVRQMRDRLELAFSGTDAETGLPALNEAIYHACEAWWIRVPKTPAWSG
jgi:hypothetical protein